MRIGIVICSREKSTRLPRKPFQLVDGKPILERLCEQLRFLDIPLIVAIPNTETDMYAKLDLGASIFGSPHKDDPLARMADAAEFFELDAVIRITHDKIFIDVPALKIAITEFTARPVDYLYSSHLMPGTGFEIISREALFRASAKFKNVEFISYAIRLVAKSFIHLEVDKPILKHSLLIDEPQDLKLMEIIHSQIIKPDLAKVKEYLLRNQWLDEVNAPPLLTIYTCVRNGEKHISAAMDSVLNLNGFQKCMEYILIDDASDDSTCEIIAEKALDVSNIRWFRNHKNLGLASSSNLAIKYARGKYIVRLDADDFFLTDNCLFEMFNHMENEKLEILYPDNHFGSHFKTQSGKDNHHVGGAMFDRKALNFVAFTDGLMNYEGLDLFLRAKDKLNIGYFNKPTFFYRQHDKSMSKTNLEEREQTRQRLLEGHNNL